MDGTTPASSDAKAERGVSIRGPAVQAIAACLIAAASYLRCDPHAPYSMLVYEKKVRTVEDPERIRRAIEIYDYRLANPWGLPQTQEQRAEYERQRAGFTRRLEEFESQ